MGNERTTISWTRSEEFSSNRHATPGINLLGIFRDERLVVNQSLLESREPTLFQLSGQHLGLENQAIW